MGRTLLRSECLIVDYLVAQFIFGYGARHAFQVAMSSLATEEQAKDVIATLAKAKSTTDDLKSAYRVEVCRWFLPYIAGFPKDADALLLARYYVAADVDAERRLSDRQLNDYERSIRQIA